MAGNCHTDWSRDISICTKYCRGECKFHIVSLFLSLLLKELRISHAYSLILYVCRPYSPTIYPTPYYLKATQKPPLNIYAGRNRFERLTHEKQKYLLFLERSKELRQIGSHSGANSCENRYLCELGTVAVDEKNASKSAHTLYKALWRISNEYVSSSLYCFSLSFL